MRKNRKREMEEGRKIITGNKDKKLKLSLCLSN
jgi:hypothetical protein